MPGLSTLLLQELNGGTVGPLKGQYYLCQGLDL